jgi:hypothetical protein
MSTSFGLSPFSTVVKALELIGNLVLPPAAFIPGGCIDEGPEANFGLLP